MADHPPIGAWKKISLIKKEPVKGTNGNWIEDSETVYEIWAGVETRSGSRTYVDGQSQINDTVQFWIYYDSALSPDVDWKIIYLGKSHTISSVQLIKEKRFHWIINAASIGVS